MWNSQVWPDSPDEDEDSDDVDGNITDDVNVVVESTFNTDSFGDTEGVRSRLKKVEVSFCNMHYSSYTH